MNTLDPFASKPAKKTPSRQPQNFAEALKSIGGYTVKSATRDLIGGVAKDMVSGITGGSTQSTDYTPGRNEFVNEWLKPQDQRIEQEVLRRSRLKELSSTPVYDRNQEQVNRQIKELQEQLAMLAKDLAVLGTGVQKAIEEQIVSPGAYHVSFFEKLKSFIITLRKQVHESANWLEVSYSRRQSQNHYWGNVKKSGTKFMLSQERYMATSAG
jgi:hypothetical protein